MRRTAPVLWTAGIAIGVVSEVLAFGWNEPSRWIPDLVTGWSLIALGLIGAERRPESRTGALLAASGVLWFAPNFHAVGGVIGWLAGQWIYLHRAPLIHAMLAYPTGRATSRLARGAIVVGYASSIAPAIWGDEVATIVLAALLVAVSAATYVGSVGSIRRVRLIALRAAATFGFVVAASAAARLTEDRASVDTVVLYVYEATLIGVAAYLLAGLLSPLWERAAVTDLVVELGEVMSGTLQGELARALGDPSLEVGFWLEDQGAFVGAEGEMLALPTPGSDRAVTILEREGEPLAALVHDPAVLEDPGLVEAVTAAARLQASNARLRGEVQGRADDLEASRKRILEAADEERRRLERRLRDGAERRLLELGEILNRGAENARGTETRERVATAQTQLTQTLEDLRRLANGLQPRVLSELGLAAALETLTDDLPFPVDVRVDVAMPPELELVAYFVCAEALSNVAKHAAASRAVISVTGDGHRALVQIEDDGVGGADAALGTGLRGMADRVEAFGGRLAVQSEGGRGTRLTAELPLDAEPRTG
jgi:signal transduction histidine kinase